MASHGLEQTAVAAATLEPERLRVLAGVGSVAASTAFAQFVGSTLHARDPVLEAADAPLDTECWSHGVFFTFHGDLQGEVALLLSRATCEAIQAAHATAATAAAGADAGEGSLLLELANVVASQTLSGVADALAGRILLSIPSLVGGGAARELRWRTRRAGRAGGLRVACEFADPDGRLGALLLLVPAPSTAPGPSDTVSG